MNLRDFDFDLPAELIASEPAKIRDLARLFVLKKDGSFEHRFFKDILEFIKSGDILLLNDTKVIPARLIAKKPTGGKVEILLIRESSDYWEVMSNRRYSGEIILEAGSQRKEATLRDGKLFFDGTKEELLSFGLMPLPPYIKRLPNDADKNWYQTVYARQEGSIAAPTAGLHFTEHLLETIRKKGVLIRYLTLHVGSGTFIPIKADSIVGHKMEAETFEVQTRLLEEIKEVRTSGRRLITVGTTTTRAIEAIMSGRYITLESPNGTLKGSTDIFIYPGYEFRTVDALITNFHLPRSTPLLLTSAFAGRERILHAYKEAVQAGYRFFSYGDAMFIE